MAAVSGRRGFVYYTDDGGTTYTQIARVKEIALPQNIDEEESTSHDSGGTREYIPGHDDSTAQLTIVYDDSDATHSALEGFADNKTLFGFRFRPRVGAGNRQSTWTSAFITNLEHGAPLEGVQELTITIRLSGAPTRTTQ